MDLSMSLSSALPITQVTAEQWNSRVERNIGSLSSLSTIPFDCKVYFDEFDGKFKHSNLAILENAKEWIGNWAGGWLIYGGEVLYRNIWRLSYLDTIEGLLKVKFEISQTRAIASRFLEMIRRGEIPPVNPKTIKKEFKRIQRNLGIAELGTARLEAYYSKKPKEKDALKPTLEDFYKEINRFAADVLKDIKTLSGQHSLSLSMSVAMPTSLEGCDQSVLPQFFISPKDERERAFNLTIMSQFTLMMEYMKKNAVGIIERTQQSEKELYKEDFPDQPFPISVCKASGNIYFNYGISIVPAGEGGAHKHDSRVHCYLKGDVANLSTIIRNVHGLNVANNEERFLKHLKKKAFPNVAETYDILWESAWGCQIQHIYQKYYPHGDLLHNLVRLQGKEGKIKKIILGALRGLSHLAREKIAHLDIKAENIFLDQEDEPFIGDFGLSGYLDEKIRVLQGTPLYMDPTISFKIAPHYDLWAFGLLMYQLLHLIKNPPEDKPWPWFKSLGEYGTSKKVRELNLNQKEKDFPEPSKEDIWWHACWELLQIDFALRPTAAELYDRLQKTNAEVPR